MHTDKSNIHMKEELKELSTMCLSIHQFSILILVTLKEQQIQLVEPPRLNFINMK